MRCKNTKPKETQRNRAQARMKAYVNVRTLAYRDEYIKKSEIVSALYLFCLYELKRFLKMQTLFSESLPNFGDTEATRVERTARYMLW